ncbi:hypothetical protein ACDX78_06625 [Virgibacillus oceani]
MKIKTFYALDNSKLDKKVNEFLNSGVEVVDIKFSNPLFYFSAMVLFDEK